MNRVDNMQGRDQKFIWRDGFFSSPFIPFPLFLFIFFFSFPLICLLRKTAPQMQLGGLGERCKLPQPGTGHSPGRERIFGVFRA